MYSLPGLAVEPKLFCTETLFGDWSGETLLLAKDAAPVSVILERIANRESNPWRHGERDRDPMGFTTNENVAKLAKLLSGGKLYGSALAHMLKEDANVSGPLMGMRAGSLHDHLARVLEFVISQMVNLRAIVCLGKDSFGLVSTCSVPPPHVSVGQAAMVRLYGRQLLLARLHHPSRPFTGGWPARREEWEAIANRVNARINGDHQRHHEE